MQIERQVTLPATREQVFDLVDDLACYPQWMDLVHEVVEVESAQCRAWEVELRAKVGPLARSKRLRMVRTVHEVPSIATFQRAEVDGRRHSPWILTSRLEPVADGTELAMTLTYGGSLWTGAVLQRVLDDHVQRGAAALLTLVSTPRA